MAAILRPALIAPIPDDIPFEMRKLRRWAPWRAEWNPKANKGQGKWSKIPHRPARPVHGLSNKSAAGWATFDEAMAVYRAHDHVTDLVDQNGAPIVFAGVGYLMTGPHGITGIDLDHCVTDGVVDDWAAEVAAKFDSYTEISPSGTGLHIMVAGGVPEDWANHKQGVEVYGGNKPRFLCITGHRVRGTPDEMRRPRDPDAFGYVASKYRESGKATAEVEDLHLPALIPAELLPELSDLGLPVRVRNFLLDGPEVGDRSNQLFAAAVALAQAGLPREEIFSILEANEHAMEIALDHRRQDYDKALRYLWKDQACRGAAKAEELRQERVDDFPDYEADAGIPASAGATEQAAPAAPQALDSTDDFEDLGPIEQQEVAAPAPPVKAPRFTPLSPATFLKRKPGSWIIKGVWPRAGLAVIYGASSSGKTFFTLDLAAAVVRGEAWRGCKVQKGRGVYVVAEGAGGFRNRLEAYCEFHGVDPETFDIGVVADAPNLLDKENVRDLIKALLAFGKVDFIVIDTYARAMAGGNENDAKDVGQAVAHCDLIHRKTGAMVVLVHHSGKDATKGARGSGALRAAADLEIEVVQTREYRAATVTKQKDGEDGKEYQFKLQEVEIGRDEEGDAITSCVVEHRENVTPDQRKISPEGVNEKLVYGYIETVGVLDSGSILRTELIENTYEMLDTDATPGAKDRRKERVARAIKSLVRKNLLEDDGLVVRIK